MASSVPRDRSRAEVKRYDWAARREEVAAIRAPSASAACGHGRSPTGIGSKERVLPCPLRGDRPRGAGPERAGDSDLATSGDPTAAAMIGARKRTPSWAEGVVGGPEGGSAKPPD